MPLTIVRWLVIWWHASTKVKPIWASKLAFVSWSLLPWLEKHKCVVRVTCASNIGIKPDDKNRRGVVPWVSVLLCSSDKTARSASLFHDLLFMSTTVNNNGQAERRSCGAGSSQHTAETQIIVTAAKRDQWYSKVAQRWGPFKALIASKHPAFTIYNCMFLDSTKLMAENNT